MPQSFSVKLIVATKIKKQTNKSTGITNKYGRKKETKSATRKHEKAQERAGKRQKAYSDATKIHEAITKTFDAGPELFVPSSDFSWPTYAPGAECTAL